MDNAIAGSLMVIVNRLSARKVKCIGTSLDKKLDLNIQRN